MRCFGSIAIVVVVTFAAIPIVSRANGAVWFAGAKSGIPGPVKQSNLILEKEHVVFDARHNAVTADFHIFQLVGKADSCDDGVSSYGLGRRAVRYLHRD